MTVYYRRPQSLTNAQVTAKKSTLSPTYSASLAQVMIVLHS